MNDEQTYWGDLCDKVRQDIRQYELEIENNTPTEARIKEAIEHHKKQLERLGATLNDDVMEVLESYLKAVQINAKIEKRYEALREYQRELRNVSGE